MQLTEEQIKKFIEINRKVGALDDYSETEVKQIANDVGNFYISMFEIFRKSKQQSNDDVKQQSK